jgi:hypothetical protein
VRGVDEPFDFFPGLLHQFPHVYEPMARQRDTPASFVVHDDLAKRQEYQFKMDG